MMLNDYRLFLVDLDDTLYLERDYVLSGLSAVADALAREPVEAQTIGNWLHQRFLTQGRERILDACLSEFGIPHSAEQIEHLVRIYREHDPDISLLPGAAELLAALTSIGDIVIVTDGLPSMQARKCRALGLAQWAVQTVYCWSLDAPKPDPEAVSPLLGHYDGPALLIGDNPRHDLCLADRAGIDAVRIRQGRFADEPSHPWSPVLEVESLSDLLACFENVQTFP